MEIDKESEEYQQKTRFLDHLGVTAWHKAGYTGTRGLTATGERLNYNEHAKQTAEVFRIIAPDRELIYLSGTVIDFTTYESGYTLWELINRGVDTMFMSFMTAGVGVEEMSVKMARIADQCCVFAAAGNDDDQYVNPYIKTQYIWGIGAYLLLVGSNEMLPEQYSSASEYVDFAAPARINGYGGTSFSTPTLCGMAALVNDMAIEKTGRPLTQSGMHQFFKDCSVDISEPGKDVKTGWGAPILPPPESVDIKKYQSGALAPEKPYEPPTVGRYDDDALIPEWAKEDVYYCRANGFMKGSDNRFRPSDNVTRAEIAATVARLHRHITRTDDNLERVTPGRASIEIAKNVMRVTPEKGEKGYEVAFAETDGELQLTWPDGKTFKVVKP